EADHEKGPVALTQHRRAQFPLASSKVPTGLPCGEQSERARGQANERNQSYDSEHTAVVGWSELMRYCRLEGDPKKPGRQRAPGNDEVMREQALAGERSSQTAKR